VDQFILNKCPFVPFYFEASPTFNVFYLILIINKIFAYFINTKNNSYLNKFINLEKATNTVYVMG
jgi:hypothetical protein